MTTIGKSKSPEQIVHHVIWRYQIGKKSNLLSSLFCKECSTSYPDSKTMREHHPSEVYLISKSIGHIPPRRK